MKYCLIFCSMLISGCSDDPDGKWTAAKDIQAYSSINGPKAFVISKGEVCAKGKYSYGKADRYTEVLCAQGKGWITEDEQLI